jgi:hypothetical protein
MLRAYHRLVRRWIVLGAAAVIAAVVGAWLSAPDAGAAYASLRQSAGELVPGTLDVYLEPPPAGFSPRMTPNAAYGERAAPRETHDVSMTLALVRQGLPELGNVRRAGPAWVLVNHGVCYFTSKGDLISPARASGGRRDGCTPKNLFLQVLDAQTGDQLFTVGGFDPSGRWSPQRGAADGAA